MVTDYRFRKKTVFTFHFFQLEPKILSSGRLILIKILLLLVEQTFRLVEITSSEIA